MLKKPTQADGRPFPLAKLTRYPGFCLLPTSNGLIILGFQAKARTKACIPILLLRLQGSLCTFPDIWILRIPPYAFSGGAPLNCWAITLYLPYTYHSFFLTFLHVPILSSWACPTIPQNGTGKLSFLPSFFTKALNVCFRNFQKFRKAQRRTSNYLEFCPLEITTVDIVVHIVPVFIFP